MGEAFEFSILTNRYKSRAHEVSTMLAAESPSPDSRMH
jgi:hypothetical protein